MITKYILLKTIIPLFLLVTIITSCGKNSSTATSPHNPSIIIINASPNSKPLGLYVNSGIIFDSLYYTKTYGYFQLGPGDYAMQFFRTDTIKTFLQDTIIGINNDTTYKNTTTLLYQTTSKVTLDTAKITVQPDSACSLFIIDSANKLKHVFVADYLADSGSGSPKLRFFNFSPNAPAVDLAISGGQVLFGNRTFNDVSINKPLATFLATNAGTYNIDVRLTGTSNVVGTIAGVVFSAGKHYTLYTKGFYGGTGKQAFGVGIISK